jgi:hypothetical protein
MKFIIMMFDKEKNWSVQFYGILTTCSPIVAKFEVDRLISRLIQNLVSPRYVDSILHCLRADCTNAGKRDCLLKNNVFQLGGQSARC